MNKHTLQDAILDALLFCLKPAHIVAFFMLTMVWAQGVTIERGQQSSILLLERYYGIGHDAILVIFAIAGVVALLFQDRKWVTIICATPIIAYTLVLSHLQALNRAPNLSLLATLYLIALALGLTSAGLRDLAQERTDKTLHQTLAVLHEVRSEVAKLEKLKGEITNGVRPPD